MTYEQLNQWFPKRGGRRWCKWCNYIYLRKQKGVIIILHGYRYKAARMVACWYPNGRFKFKHMCYYPSLRSKLNYLLPKGYSIVSHRYYSFLKKNDEEPLAFYVRSENRRTIPDYYTSKTPTWVWINKSGINPKLGQTLSEIKAKLIAEDQVRALPRRRGRYWVRKARGVFRKPCGKTYFQGCKWHRTFPRPTTNWSGDCGCRVYTKKAVSRDTVKTILDEKNATVRTSKIQIYGIEKFFTDARAKTINKEAGYELLELNTGRAESEDNRWGGRQAMANIVLAALRMECSTTGKVYVNTVPPELRTVRAALDWMYNTDHYLERVGHQT